MNSHVNMGLSMSCTSLSTSIRKSTVTSRSPLMSQESRAELSAGRKSVVFHTKQESTGEQGETSDSAKKISDDRAMMAPKFK